MDSAKISVLLPVYNVSKHLERCVQSLKEQNYDNLEIIFVDDKSTDNSLELLKQLTADMTNVKIIEHEQNQGLLKARLTGLLNCTGDYIHFLDSDDFVDIDFYASYIEKLNQEKPDICFCMYRKIGPNSVPKYTINHKQKFYICGDDYECMKELFKPSVFYSSYHYMWTKIISKDLWEKSKQDLINLIEPAGYILGGEEDIFNIVLFSKAKKIVNHQGSRVNYCEHQDQSVNLTKPGRLLSQLDSFIRSSIIIRDYAVKKGFYNIYYTKDKNFISLIHAFKHKVQDLDCQNEYNKILEKYGYNEEILKKIELLKNESK